MFHEIKAFLKSNVTTTEEALDFLTRLFESLIISPEFAQLYAQRIKAPQVDFGLGNSVNHQWSKAMSQLTDAMTAVVAAIKAGQASVDPTHIASIDASIATLTTSETADASAIADVTAALGVLKDGLAPDAPIVGEPVEAGGTDTSASTDTAQ